MKRIEEIDIAKGIAIIMVVLGHSYSMENGLTQLIYSFHMPFFFIVSGILYRIQYDTNGRIIFRYKKKAKVLLLPWIIWGSAYHIYISCLRIIDGQTIAEQIKIYVGQFIELGFGSVWFLPALYIASAVVLSEVGHKKIVRMIVVASLIIGLYMPKYTGVANTLLRTVLACAFIGIGFLGANIFMRKTKILNFVICILIFIILASYNEGVSMHSRTFLHPTIFLITGVLGTYILLNFCKYLKDYKKNLLIEQLKIYGKKSIIVLCMHKFLTESIYLFDYKFLNNLLMTLGTFGGVILTVIVMLVLTLAMPFIEKYFGKTLGTYEKGR